MKNKVPKGTLEKVRKNEDFEVPQTVLRKAGARVSAQIGSYPRLRNLVPKVIKKACPNWSKIEENASPGHL